MSDRPSVITLYDFNPFGDVPFTPPPRARPPASPTVTTDECARLPFYDALLACTACSCRREAAQVVPCVGPLDARFLVVGQNPGEDEDREGIPFIGQSGEEFNEWLKVLGLARGKVVVTNAAKCHTTGNRLPNAKELATCADLWLAQEIAELAKVEVLMTLGKPAAVAVLGRDAPPLTPLMARHYRIRAFGRELSVLPLPHPAYLLRARHFAPMFRETVLTHVRLTLEEHAPGAYQWSRL